MLHFPDLFMTYDLHQTVHKTVFTFCSILVHMTISDVSSTKIEYPKLIPTPAKDGSEFGIASLSL